MVYVKGSKKNKMRKMDNRMRCGLAFSACILAANATLASDFESSFSENLRSANLIYSAHKDYAKYDLVVGKMEYMDSSESEGFRPAAQKPLLGAIDRQLYDYPKQKSAIEIFDRAVASLQRERYSILYQCSGEDCGGAAGWKLFLSKKLGGDGSFQHYVVGAKERSSGASNYVVMYVNDLAGQPRALVDMVSVPKPTRSSNKDAPGSANIHAEKRRASIYFNFGEYSLPDSDDQMMQAKKFVAANLENCPIRVIGYTDPVGSESSNQTLAKARVDEIIKYVSTMNELLPGCLIPDPRGVDQNAVHDNFKSSRRVDLEVASNHNN